MVAGPWDVGCDRQGYMEYGSHGERTSEGQECPERLHEAGEMAQPIECLPCNQEDLVLITGTHV